MEKEIIEKISKTAENKSMQVLEDEYGMVIGTASYLANYKNMRNRISALERGNEQNAINYAEFLKDSKYEPGHISYERYEEFIIRIANGS